MQQEKKDFLTLAIPPARLNITETAWFLGFAEHDISVLISVGLLKPLGHRVGARTSDKDRFSTDASRISAKIAIRSRLQKSFWQLNSARFLPVYWQDSDRIVEAEVGIERDL